MCISIIGNPVGILRQKFSQSIGLPLRELLPEGTLNEAVKQEEIRYGE